MATLAIWDNVVPPKCGTKVRALLFCVQDCRLFALLCILCFWQRCLVSQQRPPFSIYANQWFFSQWVGLLEGQLPTADSSLRGSSQPLVTWLTEVLIRPKSVMAQARMKDSTDGSECLLRVLMVELYYIILYSSSIPAKSHGLPKLKCRSHRVSHLFKWHWCVRCLRGSDPQWCQRKLIGQLGCVPNLESSVQLLCLRMWVKGQVFKHMEFCI